MLNLSSDERRALRARAHSLNPVVSISQNGLSEAVVSEVDVNLTSHQLIKIRVYNDDRQAREQFLATLCERLDAAPVQHIGKLLVIWRPPTDDQAGAAARPRRRRAEPRRSKRSFQGSSGS
ncbi:MAG: YhbY family RNA-binding protein [Candidatus Accumulibacter sp.]|uniref:YhbY family RNA-binding protein n=1 Tax=Accumulibacter sp. TaxID=2053492 RepID=UPI001DC4A27C|nr:YhbY family RNA-binding protein [Accumulibacter sp.]MCB1940926.1 YhbY family RNA-binding protein [Accumulibacter sp.]MCP5249214.1 YhbY family RNA-binding protein [Accumulibacter sp.]